MKIAIVGGTGDLGEALAKRLCSKYEVIVGSRSAEKASVAAQKIRQEVKKTLGTEVVVKGFQNEMASSLADVVVLAVPYEFALETANALSKSINPNSILVCPVVPMKKGEGGFEYSPPNSLSMAQAVSNIVKVPVVAAFHTLPAERLGDLSVQPDFDVPICGDSKEAIETVKNIVLSIPNLRPLVVGPLKLSYLVESLTPLILNVAIKNKLKNLSIKFV
ncbi:NADPH-dependent F420 reductase [Candidatus Marsarchaeota G2 archaeon ECH_B_SAG-G16]|uniref:NADPH-dependent F420 reductase n=2 Tax=Candidatus Marsarchaeota group 2 TaxID=2203771 RepID=A0A2R6C3I0_9ARCH|nr:MAG: NADPH-dependent F420 reductase [Candidatus Marsarchaeota G2 archaeon ECH_B_SAG-G16]PSO05408.1 MAG: NADPH-dependent F420 reductase [Candidatus Marsarchaeota G2 archaeon ECH_B_SAG-G06]